MSELRTIASDAEARSAAPLGPDEDGFRVQAPLSDGGFQALAARLAERPDACLMLDAHGTTDLEMLVHFSGLRRLRVRSLRLESWDGVRHVADSLEELSMGETTLRPVSIRPIAELRRLRTLGLIGPVKDAPVISGLENLEEVHLRSVTLPDLAPLLRMRRLRVLYLGLGGTADLRLLPELASLEELELWRIRGLDDLSPVADAVSLVELKVQAMGAVTELPSLRRLGRLRRLTLETMRGIIDLRPLAEAPALEELLLIDMCQLEPEALRPLVGHSTLRRGIWGLCSDRKNAEAWELLPLGDPPWNYERSKQRREKAAARDAKRRASGRA